MLISIYAFLQQDDLLLCLTKPITSFEILRVIHINRIFRFAITYYINSFLIYYFPKKSNKKRSMKTPFHITYNHLKSSLQKNVNFLLNAVNSDG